MRLKARPSRARQSGKTSKTYRLTPQKIRAAQRALGASTATEAIETALDLVIFRKELVDGTRSMLGVHLASPDEPER